jgi:hypothetical protein
MNPEEGQLRPQLLDRLPLSVEVQRISNANDRVEIVKRNIEFENSPEGFIKKYGSQEEGLKNRISQARKTLEKVHIYDKLIQAICQACVELKVDGMRPDIVITKTAKTIAAFENKIEVGPEHILKAAELALNHRTRENGFLEPATPQEIGEVFTRKLEEAKNSESESTRTVEQVKGKRNETEPEAKEEKKKLFPPFGLRRITKMEKEVAKAKIGGLDSRSFLSRSSDLRKGRFLTDLPPEKGGSSAPQPPDVKWSEPKVTRGVRFLDRFRESKFPHVKFLFKTKKFLKKPAANIGKRAETITATNRGRARGWKMPSGKPSDIHLPATIRAAARKKRFRDEIAGMALSVHREDVRENLSLQNLHLIMACRCNCGHALSLQEWENKKCSCGERLNNSTVVFYQDTTEPLGVVKCVKCEKEFCVVCGQAMDKSLHDLPIIKTVSFAHFLPSLKKEKVEFSKKV